MEEAYQICKKCKAHCPVSQVIDDVCIDCPRDTYYPTQQELEMMKENEEEMKRQSRMWIQDQIEFENEMMITDEMIEQEQQEMMEKKMIEKLMHLKPNDKKRVIGGKLFPKIQAIEPRLAGKLLSMLIEMPNTDLVQLIFENKRLRNQINESMDILKSHQTEISYNDSNILSTPPQNDGNNNGTKQNILSTPPPNNDGNIADKKDKDHQQFLKNQENQGSEWDQYEMERNEDNQRILNQDNDEYFDDNYRGRGRGNFSFTAGFNGDNKQQRQQQQQQQYNNNNNDNDNDNDESKQIKPTIQDQQTI